MVDSMTRVRLITLGTECLQHMLGLARKYSDIGDCDRCMILRSNVLLTVTGLLEVYRSVFEEGVITTTEEFLESRQKCAELLVLLANTARETMDGEGQRTKDFITVFSSRSPWHLTDCNLSTTTEGMEGNAILKLSFVLFQLAVLRALSFHSFHILFEPSTKASSNSSCAHRFIKLLRSTSTLPQKNSGESCWMRQRTRQDHHQITCLKLL